MASIQVKNLNRQFGKIKAIQNVSFTVNHGEIVGFLGPNGAGKSTTLRILSGTMTATSGEAWVAGVPVAQNPYEVKRRVGYMPENNPLPDDMRVAEYLNFRARLKEVPAARIRETVQEAMEICDLARTARRKIIGMLSKGFRQRVGIADALLGNPEVIIMDEPTIGLDPHQIQGIRRLIDSLRGRMAVILSSHILPEIEHSCDRVIIINRGRIVANGTHSELQEEFVPGHRFAIEIKGTDEAVLESLKTNQIQAEILDSSETKDDRRKINLRAADNDILGTDLIAAIHSHPSCTLHSLVSRKPSLEEIFLAATKRSWEETIDHKRRTPTTKPQQAKAPAD